MRLSVNGRPDQDGGGNAQAHVRPALPGIARGRARVPIAVVFEAPVADEWAGLVVAPVAAWEGLEAWRGECCCRPTCMIITAGEASSDGCRDCDEC